MMQYKAQSSYNNYQYDSLQAINIRKITSYKKEVWLNRQPTSQTTNQATNKIKYSREPIYDFLLTTKNLCLDYLNTLHITQVKTQLKTQVKNNKSPNNKKHSDSVNLLNTPSCIQASIKLKKNLSQKFIDLDNLYRESNNQPLGLSSLKIYESLTDVAEKLCQCLQQIINKVKPDNTSSTIIPINLVNNIRPITQIINNSLNFHAAQCKQNGIITKNNKRWYIFPLQGLISYSL